MSQLIENYGGTVLVLLVVALFVFLAVRRLVLDKKAGIGPCGQKCSNCQHAGHCEQDVNKAQETEFTACSGVCSGCKYAASCHKTAE